MPVSRKANEIGSFNAEEIALFWRVFDALKVPGESEADAEHRASRIIANYSAGIADERELIEISLRLSTFALGDFQPNRASAQMFRWAGLMLILCDTCRRGRPHDRRPSLRRDIRCD